MAGWEGENRGGVGVEPTTSGSRVRVLPGVLFWGGLMRGASAPFAFFAEVTGENGGDGGLDVGGEFGAPIIRSISPPLPVPDAIGTPKPCPNCCNETPHDSSSTSSARNMSGTFAAAPCARRARPEPKRQPQYRSSFHPHLAPRAHDRVRNCGLGRCTTDTVCGHKAVLCLPGVCTDAV